MELNAFQELQIELEPQDNVLDEIVVHAGENPANILLRKVIKNRKKNNPKNGTQKTKYPFPTQSIPK